MNLFGMYPEPAETLHAIAKIKERDEAVFLSYIFLLYIVVPL